MDRDLTEREMNASAAYGEMLAGRGLKVGDQVVCSYRMPTANQWWVHPLWVASSYNAASFDSRYLGPVAASSVRELVKPILVWK